ncbi:hypothetical protein KVT40_004062 [Elsinoe batatas]|uniref:Uncharacterized protein n=1 Tax=Elsinoe batatas TaxID=2601811 RepID=A0A8K0L1Z1_9PEZI|nr:hypothetical protein KVT40_004062 [Elsinoe batatas]
MADIRIASQFVLAQDQSSAQFEAAIIAFQPAYRANTATTPVDEARKLSKPSSLSSHATLFTSTTNLAQAPQLSLLRDSFHVLHKFSSSFATSLHVALADKMVTKAAGDFIWAQMIEAFGGSAKLSKRSYDNKQLYAVSMKPADRSVRISPGRTVPLEIDFSKSTRQSIPDIWLKSMDRKWLKRVIDALNAAWMQAPNDFLQAWLVAAEVADSCNTAMFAGERPPGSCQCTSPADRDQAIHMCSYCPRMVLCRLTKTSRYGLQICNGCHEKQSDIDTTLIQSIVTKRIKFLMKSDLRMAKLDITKKEYRQLVQTNIEHFRQLLKAEEPTTYPDEYAGSRKRQITVDHASQDPEDPTLDAIMAMAPPGAVIEHEFQNLAPTTQAVNLLKQIQIPPVLPRFRKWRTTIADFNANKIGPAELDREARRLVEDCCRFRHIRLKMAWKRKDRVHSYVDKADYDCLREEVVSGKLHPNEKGPWDIHDRDAQVSTLSANLGFTFSAEDQRDGCAFFAHESITPDACIWKCSIEESDPEKALKENYKATYDEFMGLSMTLANHDLLRFAIAYRKHGQDIASGFSDNCKGPSDFRPEDSNLSIETCSSNYFKLNLIVSFW